MYKTIYTITIIQLYTCILYDACKINYNMFVGGYIWSLITSQTGSKHYLSNTVDAAS